VVQIARDEELSKLSAEMLTDNIGMQPTFRRNGFLIRAGDDMSSVAARLDL
jgi:hypothetical protein